MRKMLFTHANKPDFGVMFLFLGYYSPNGSPHCRCIGFVGKKMLIKEQWRGEGEEEDRGETE